MEIFDLDDIISTIKGKRKNFTRLPYSLWKHFPEHDLKPEDAVKAHVQFQDLVNADLIKISPHSKYALVDFGVEFNPTDYNKETGSYITKKHPITELKDWEKIDVVDPQNGEIGKQIELVKQLSKKFPNIPKMMTIFLPTMIARKMVKNDQLLNQFKEDKDLLKDRLQVITDVITDFSKICVESGTNGLFLATQETDPNENWNYEHWSQIALPFDRQIADKLRTKSEFLLLHLHGNDIFFKNVLKKLKIDAINFHAFDEFPQFFSDSSMHKIFTGGLLGGLKDGLLHSIGSDTNPISKDLENLITSLDLISERIILAPNCVLPQDLTSEQLANISKK